MTRGEGILSGTSGADRGMGRKEANSVQRIGDQIQNLLINSINIRARGRAGELTGGSFDVQLSPTPHPESESNREFQIY